MPICCFRLTTPSSSTKAGWRCISPQGYGQWGKLSSSPSKVCFMMGENIPFMWRERGGIYRTSVLTVVMNTDAFASSVPLWTSVPVCVDVLRIPKWGGSLICSSLYFMLGELHLLVPLGILLLTFLFCAVLLSTFRTTKCNPWSCRLEKSPSLHLSDTLFSTQHAHSEYSG